MKPSVGRIVHYRESGHCRAAIITDVDLPKSPRSGLEEVGLTIFPGCRSISPVHHGESRTDRTWHWPEREEA